VLTYDDEALSLRTRDNYGDTGPNTRQFSQVRLNGRLIHQAKAKDGSKLFTLTVGAAGFGATQRMGLDAGDALLWLHCRSQEGCAIAQAVMASVRFRNSASD
jgi:hypothetical protein